MNSTIKIIQKTTLDDKNDDKKSDSINHYLKNIGDEILEIECLHKGFCPVCQQETIFISTNKWLRDYYKCKICSSLPRDRALFYVMDSMFPSWKEKEVHEYIPENRNIADCVPKYSYSKFFKDLSIGTVYKECRNENIEELTFLDSTFDYFISIDVLKHVFHPDRAIKEMLRVVKENGAVVFAVPKYKSLLHSCQRAKIDKNGVISHLFNPKYHGDSIDEKGSLVTWEYGQDFKQLLQKWIGNLVVIKMFNREIPKNGIEGEFLDIFVLEKVKKANNNSFLKSNVELKNQKNNIFNVAKYLKYLESLELDMTFDQLYNYFWLTHPKYCFFKSIPENGKLLDIGAGPGSLIGWKYWFDPQRTDLNMYAIDIIEGEHFKKYSEYKICDINKDGIDYPDNFFDSILCNHVIEHISNWKYLFTEIKRVLKPGRTGYLELPTLESTKIPSREIFLKEGFNCSTLNFYDDPTHIKTDSLKNLEKMFEEIGVCIIGKGFIENKFLEDKLVKYGFDNQNENLTTYGLWSKFKFCQYLIIKNI